LIAKVSRLTDAKMSAISVVVDSFEEARNQVPEHGVNREIDDVTTDRADGAD